MARIPETTFKDWKDGDIVNAAEYERELEIIRAAVNDNYDRISTLQSAAGGSISRIPSGTAFPTSNIQPGQIFFRSDQEILYILGADSQWEAFSPKSFVDTHISNKANPHEVTATQVGAYTKAEVDTKFKVANSPIGYCHRGSLSVQPNAYVRLTWSTVAIDTHSMYQVNKDTFVIPETGYYRFNGRIVLTLEPGVGVYMEVQKVGTTSKSSIVGTFASGVFGYNTLNGDTIAYLVQGEEIEVLIRQNSSGASTLNNAHFTITKL